MSVFFIPQLLSVNEVPDRPVVDPQTALGELSHKTAQRKVRLDPLQKPYPMLAPDRLGPVTPELARRNAAGLAKSSHPIDDGADPQPKLRRHSITGQPAPHHSPKRALAQIDRIWLPHSRLASSPASMLNQICSSLGIPYRFTLAPSRSSCVDRGRSTRPSPPAQWREERVRARASGRGGHR